MITSKTSYTIRAVSSFSSWGKNLCVRLDSGDELDIELSPASRIELRDMLTRCINEDAKRDLEKAQELAKDANSDD